jgi:hypothetical protein
MAKPLVWGVVTVPLLIAASAGCGGSGASSGASPGGSSGTPTVNSGGSCGGPASPSASQYLASATVAFVGIMLPGPDAEVGSSKALTSPARVRVVHWLKGSGPPIVTVSTGAVRNSAGAAENADGILPAAGQRWVIYAMSKQMPYQASICSGSALASGK